MHRTNLYNVAQLLTLQNTVTAATSHSRYIQKLGTIDHMIIWQQSVFRFVWLISCSQNSLTLSSRNADSLGFHLVAKTTLILPQGRGHARLRAWWGDLSGRIINIALQW